MDLDKIDIALRCHSSDSLESDTYNIITCLRNQVASYDAAIITIFVHPSCRNLTSDLTLAYNELEPVLRSVCQA